MVYRLLVTRFTGNGVQVSWQTLPVVLGFLKYCSSANPMLKDWMGSQAGHLFWTPLLELFCTNSTRDLSFLLVMWIS